MAVAVLENATQLCNNHTPPLTAGGLWLQPDFVAGLCRGYARGVCETLTTFAAGRGYLRLVGDGLQWVDDSGVVHYSDQPNPKAQKLTISGAQTYGAKDAAVSAPPPSSSPAARTAGIAVCAIDTPSPGQVYLDTYSLSGHVTLANMANGSEVALRMDGQDISPLIEQNGTFQLEQVERGEHSLTLQVTDDHGNVTCQANAVTFAIRQRTASGGGNSGTTAPTVPGAPTAPMAPGVGVPPLMCPWPGVTRGL